MKRSAAGYCADLLSQSYDVLYQQTDGGDARSAAGAQQQGLPAALYWRPL